LCLYLYDVAPDAFPAPSRLRTPNWLGPLLLVAMSYLCGEEHAVRATFSSQDRKPAPAPASVRTQVLVVLAVGSLCFCVITGAGGTRLSIDRDHVVETKLVAAASSARTRRLREPCERLNRLRDLGPGCCVDGSMIRRNAAPDSESPKEGLAVLDGRAVLAVSDGAGGRTGLKVQL
jgi:hypothetical protein